jgi:hypothetical protein
MHNVGTTSISDVRKRALGKEKFLAHALIARITGRESVRARNRRSVAVTHAEPAAESGGTPIGKLPRFDRIEGLLADGLIERNQSVVPNRGALGTFVERGDADFFRAERIERLLSVVATGPDLHREAEGSLDVVPHDVSGGEYMAIGNEQPGACA